jgi:NTE family protein
MRPLPNSAGVHPMRAFVLWGAGSLGAAQVGMLRALAAREIQADIVVGASIGALNAAYYGAKPNADGVEELAERWLSVGRHDVYPLSPTEMLRAWTSDLPWHPVRGAMRAVGALNYAFPVKPLSLEAVATGRRNYLFDNDRLADFLKRALPVERIDDTKSRLAVVTADARNGDSVVLNKGPLVPALLASTAIPGLYPTVSIDGRNVMDGGLANETALDVAIENGATEVYLLSPGFSRQLPTPPSTVISMMLHAYNLLSEQRMATSIARIGRRVRLHLLAPTVPDDVLPIDFRQTAELITRSTEEATRMLDKDRDDAARESAAPLTHHHAKVQSGRLGGVKNRPHSAG